MKEFKLTCFRQLFLIFIIALSKIACTEPLKKRVRGERSLRYTEIRFIFFYPYTSH